MQAIELLNCQVARKIFAYIIIPPDYLQAIESSNCWVVIKKSQDIKILS